MEFTKGSGVGGKWLDKKTLQNGDMIKLVSEATEIQAEKGKQIVAKCRVKGVEGEASNISINNPSKDALIDAFGKDSKEWVNKPLMVNVEKTVIGGKRGTALYLIPEGFEVKEDAGGYLVIVKKGDPVAEVQIAEGEINPDDIPF